MGRPQFWQPDMLATLDHYQVVADFLKGGRLWTKGQFQPIFNIIIT